MKLKKLVAVTLAGAMAASLVACGGESNSNSNTNTDTDTSETAVVDDNNASDDNASDDSSSTSDEKLVIWTLAVDLQDMAAKYQEETGVECEVVVTAPADYPTKVETAILAGEKEPDIIVGEPQMLDAYYDAGLLADLDALGAKDHDGEIVDYVWEKGKSPDGVQRAVSYQITPAGIYYRRDIAQEVFGTEDPEEIGKLFADYNTILETAKTLKDKGYKIFASDGEISYFANKEAWVVDDTLNVPQSRYDFMDLCINLYQGGYTANAAAWSSPWYTAMAGEIPAYDTSVNVWDEDALAEAAEGAEMTQVFAYGLPSWGVLTMRDNYKETEGKWGVCAGPSSGFGGGTYIGISENSERKESAWKFIEWVCFNQDTLDWWLDYSKGDTVSNKETLDRHKDDENATYGNQKLYQFWLQEAEKIDLSIVTPYDTAIGDAWNNAITSIKTGEKDKDAAINEFYDVVESTYPEITINR